MLVLGQAPEKVIENKNRKKGINIWIFKGLAHMAKTSFDCILIRIY